MSKFIGRFLAVLAFAGWAGGVSAVPITDTVTVGSNEWAQAADFTGLSWNDINSACPLGICSGTLTSDSGMWDMDGWTWASVDQVNGLFNAYLSDAGVEDGNLLAGVDTYNEPGSAWAPAFLSDFDATCAPPGCDESYIVYGTLFQPNGGQAVVYNVADNALSPDHAGNTTIIWDNNDVGSLIGGWFYKEAEAPTPATISLIGLALASLGWTRRRKA